MAAPISFVSSRVKEQEKRALKQARDVVLAKAKEDYEKAVKKKEKAKKRGEDTWLLPSLDLRIKKEQEALKPKKQKKKEKKKKKKKEKKSKKSKKHKEDSSSSSSDSDDEEAMWVEKTNDSSSQDQPPAGVIKGPKLQRDDWMSSEFCDLLPTVSRQELREKARKEKEERDEVKRLMDNPGQHEKELNPYWKDGGTGLPEADPGKLQTLDSSVVTGDAGVSWWRQAYRRCQEQAKDEGRSLEDVAEERYGSLTYLTSMLESAEQSLRERDKTRGIPGNSPRGRMYKDRQSGSRNIQDPKQRDAYARERYTDSRDYRNRDRDKNLGNRNRSRDRESRNRDRNISRDRESRNRDRSRSRDREARNKDRSRSRDRESRNRDRSRSRDREARNRDRSRSRDRESRNRDRSRSRDRGSRRRGRSSSSETSSDSSRSSSEDRSRSRDRKTDRSRSRDRRSRDRSRSRDRNTRDRSRSRERKTRNRGRSRERSRSRDRRTRERDRDSERRSAYNRDTYNDRERDRKRIKSDSGAGFGSLSGLFKKPTDTETVPSRPSESGNKSGSRASSHTPGWRKKGLPQSHDKVNQEDKVKARDHKETRRDSSSGSSDSESSSSSSSGEEDKEDEKDGDAQEGEAVVQLTENEMNQLGAKLLKAQIMGDQALAGKLQSQLDAARKAGVATDSTKDTKPKKEENDEQVVVLTRTDRAGNVWPAQEAMPWGGKRGKKQKVATHSKKGERERYFADDDQFSLRDLVEKERFEKASSDILMPKTDSKDLDELDDAITTSARKHTMKATASVSKSSARHERKQLENCSLCLDKAQKHLIIALGIKVYLCLPAHTSMAPGHCMIVPMEHLSSSTIIDEDVWDEIKIYKKGLTKLFESREEDVIFMETCMRLGSRPHMVVECVPVPKETGDLAPIYFKKALQECEEEWSMNKKVVDLKDRDVRRAIPKGMPYFAVDFGLQSGYAHVIENDKLFPTYFGREVVGGMMDLDPTQWRKPRKENFDHQRQKVMEFAEWWKPYDWTQRLHESQ